MDAREACPLCGGRQREDFFSLTGTPVNEGVLCRTPDDAARAPVGDIQLCFCPDCGWIGNRLKDPALMTLDDSYDISLFHSSHYRRFARAQAERLVERYGLRDGTVVEIACGKGEFLQLMRELGARECIGFDPSAPPTPKGETGIRFVADVFDERQRDVAADLVCCRHAIEDVNDPAGFLSAVRRAIGDDDQTAVYFETLNGQRTFEEAVIWNIVYEDCSYFFPDTLRLLFERAGFEVRELGPCLDDVYLAVEASPATPEHAPPLSNAAPAQVREAVARFAARAAERQGECTRWLESIERDGRRAVVWGAGARAIAFFSMFEVREAIRYAVDVNPARQGFFLPLTAQEVVPPDFLRDYQPDLVFIMHPAFEDEIRASVAQLGLSCELALI